MRAYFDKVISTTDSMKWVPGSEFGYVNETGELADSIGSTSYIYRRDLFCKAEGITIPGDVLPTHVFDPEGAVLTGELYHDLVRVCNVMIMFL